MSESRFNEVWWPETDELTANHPKVTAKVYEIIQKHYPHLLQPAASGAYELSPESRKDLQERIIKLKRGESDPLLRSVISPKPLTAATARSGFRYYHHLCGSISSASRVLSCHPR